MKLRVSPRIDRFARFAIVLIGLVCLVLIAWDHLGLGAWLFPPATSPSTQTAACGADNLALIAPAHFSATQPATFTLEAHDHTQRAITDATLTIHSQMKAMAMDAPTVVATTEQNGDYSAPIRFGMAGDWRLAITLTQPGHPACATSFIVGVRW